METMVHGIVICVFRWLQAKVRVCRLELLPRLNAGSVCDAQCH